MLVCQQSDRGKGKPLPLFFLANDHISGIGKNFCHSQLQREIYTEYILSILFPMESSHS